MSLLRLDGLHDEGLCKTFMSLLFNYYGKSMESIKMEINRFLLKYGNSCFSNSKGIKSLNAHELRLLFAISIPILASTKENTVKLQETVLFWLLSRLLYSKHLNTEIIENMCHVFEQLGKHLESDFGTAFKTIKEHVSSVTC